MSPEQVQAHIIEHPFAALVQGGRLDSCQENGHELFFHIQGLERTSSDVYQQDGRIIERVTGRHIPLKLSFSNVTHLNCPDSFKSLETFPPDDPYRSITQMHSWQQPGMDDVFYILNLRGSASANISFFASSVAYETGNGGEPFTFERNWSPAPPMSDRVVSQHLDLYPRFGGDPITIHVDGIAREHKLFVGGLEHQPNHRPEELDVVLNLGERPSLWVHHIRDLQPNDRIVQKGEGSEGMSVDEIRAEANWVIEHLKQDQRVLVHCVAGMNRSVTICCAALMLLEELSAEDGLKRVREQHPWAKPDSHHWLMLRWLEKNLKG